MALRVLHLTGSPVSDFHCELSRLYARGCLQIAADPERYETSVAYVTPDGQWRFPLDLSDASIEAAVAMSRPEAIGRLFGAARRRRRAPDVLHPGG